MAKEDSKSNDQLKLEDAEESEALELVLFQVSECYVYMIPPRKTAASYRADEWNVNKWDWEGILKVVSKGEECIIKLEDKKTGELYARAFLRKGEPHPVETVIDSSRYFVLRVEENIGGRLRHAFIGIGFRERTEAYDFQAALHDHMKYLNKKEAAEEMEQQYQNKSTVDYSLKDGEKLVLQIKNQSGRSGKSKNLELSMNNLSVEEKNNSKETVIGLKPPPPPQAVVSPTATVQRPRPFQWTETCSPKKHPQTEVEDSSKEEKSKGSGSQDTQTVKEDLPDDDFGDFQTAG